MFLSFVYDKLFTSYKKSFPGFTDFCSPSQIAYLKPILLKEIKEIGFVSKIKNSERLIPAINHDYSEIPTDIIVINEAGKDELTHRDILGALMNLGIKRSKIGDIITEDKIYFETKNEITPYILSNLSRIKNRNVNPEVYDGELEKTYNFEEISSTVSSLRADCIAGCIAKLSRENAKNLVLSGKVSINSVILDNPSKNLNEGDVISIRGYGKYIFENTLGTTKKDRLKIIIKKYI